MKFLLVILISLSVYGFPRMPAPGEQGKAAMDNQSELINAYTYDDRETILDVAPLVGKPEASKVSSNDGDHDNAMPTIILTSGIFEPYDYSNRPPRADDTTLHRFHQVRVRLYSGGNPNRVQYLRLVCWLECCTNNSQALGNMAVPKAF